jgi:hypothetical protein
MMNEWSEWHRFPDPRKGELLIAPFGPGCYELRHGTQLVLYPSVHWFTIIEADDVLVARAKQFAQKLSGIKRCVASAVYGWWCYDVSLWQGCMT